MSRRFKPVTPHTQTMPVTKPMTIAPSGPTVPQAGVTPTRPATAPDAAPSADGWPLVIASTNVQPNTAAAVASTVLMKASEATVSAAAAEPALKPNQPTHSNIAPTQVSGRLCGFSAVWP
ncbi:hypothetical protein D3C71_1824070 [compost metagenome]